MTTSPAAPSVSLSSLSRIKIGEELVADAAEWLGSVSEEFDDTIHFAGSEPDARLLRPALARTLDEAKADLKALERALTHLRTAHKASQSE